MPTVTREQFAAFERLRQTGAMITSSQVSELTGGVVSHLEMVYIVQHLDELHRKYPDVPEPVFPDEDTDETEAAVEAEVRKHHPDVVIVDGDASPN